MPIYLLNMECDVRQNSIQIIDSYIFLKIDFDRCLDYIEDNFNSDVFVYRTRNSLKMEWAMFNLLYKLGFNGYRYSNVVFEAHATKFRKKLYSIIGSVAMLFIE